ncbi:hypothetical protein ACLMJK_005650 [Lecanora helva]
MSVEQWATTARENRFWQQTAEQQTITTYHDLLSRRITPLEAAQTISSLYVSRIEEGDVNSWYPWTILLDAVKTIESDVDSLRLVAQMLRCISQLPEPLDVSGEAVKSGINAQVFWRDMPGFSYAFRQATPFVLIEDLEGQDGVAWEDAARRVSNANIFAALYLQELVPNGPERDFSSMRKFALDQLMWTLEIETENAGQLRRAELYVPAVANWIRIAGRNLYAYCKDNRDYKNEDVPQRWMGGPEYGSELLWTGRDGYNIERWQLWNRRFDEIAAHSGVSAKVRDIAAGIAEEMRKCSESDGA